MSEVVEVYVAPESYEKGARWRWYALDSAGDQVRASRGFSVDTEAADDAIALYPEASVEIRTLPEREEDGVRGGSQ